MFYPGGPVPGLMGAQQNQNRTSEDEYRVVSTSGVGATFEEALSNLQKKQDEAFKFYKGCKADPKELQIIREDGGQYRLAQQIVFSGNLPKIYTEEEMTVKRHYSAEIQTLYLVDHPSFYYEREAHEGCVIDKLDKRVSWFMENLGEDLGIVVSADPETFYDKDYHIWHASITIECNCTKPQYDLLCAGLKSMANVEGLFTAQHKQDVLGQHMSRLRWNMHQYQISNHGYVPHGEMTELEAQCTRLLNEFFELQGLPR